MPHRFAGMLVRDILRLKKASIRNAPLPPGTPGWATIEQLVWEQIEDGARRNSVGLKTIRKLLADQRFDR